MTYRRYSRIAAVVFLLFTVYPVVVKLAEGRLTHDWLHSALHLASALAAIYGGWVASKELPARAYTWGIGLIYLILGVVGWFIEGFFLDSHLAVPLGPVDNVFHLGLGVFALAVIAANTAPRPAGLPAA